MPSTANKGYTLQVTGSNAGTWGTELNNNAIQLIDNNLGAVTTKSLTNVNVTLSATESQSLTLVTNGVLTGAVQITTACVGFFFVDNQCSGAFPLTITNDVGSSVTVANSTKVPIIADTTNGCRQIGAGVTSVTSGFGLSGTVTTTGSLSISSATPPFGFDMPVNLGLTAAVAANAITISIKDQSGADPTSTSPVLIPFRNVTTATGTPSWLSITAANSVTVSSGSTLGTSNITPFRIWVVAFNDASTIRLGVINCVTTSGIAPLYEAALTSSTAEGGGGAADSAGVYYTGTAATSKSFRILGYFEYSSGLTTAGTWNAAPDAVQLFGPGIKKPGNIVQLQRSTINSLDTTTVAIPFDNTIPQNTEGKQFLSLAITPASKLNLLYVDVSATLAGVSGNQYAMALFQDSTVNALCCTSYTANNGIYQSVLQYFVQAGTTSTTTFKMRAGPPNTSTTLVLNGNYDSTQKYGGVLISQINIQEIMA